MTDDMNDRLCKSREALLAREATETLSYEDRRELAALDDWFHEDDDAIQSRDSLLKVAPEDKEVMLHLFAGIMMNAAYWHRLPESVGQVACQPDRTPLEVSGSQGT